MLVLTRKTNEEIILDGVIRVSVIEIRGNRVKIGVEAPQSVSIQRTEICAIVPTHKSVAPVRRCDPSSVAL